MRVGIGRVEDLHQSALYVLEKENKLVGNCLHRKLYACTSRSREVPIEGITRTQNNGKSVLL